MSGKGERTGRIEGARIDWQGDAPHSTTFGDIYFSGDGSAETDHVFLNGNELAARFARAGAFSIGELGFGTGLNFLKSWALWRATPKPAGARLRFFSVEQFPLNACDLARAHRAWPDLTALAARLRAALPPLVPGFHQLHVADDVCLILAIGEAGDVLNRADGAVDAWFFDGFSPAKNPAMWRADLFKDAARLSRPGATFATFTVAGAVRRALSQAGFSVETRPGFGRKKEMLAGRLAAAPNKSPSKPRGKIARRAPWFETANPKILKAGAAIGVIGGGIAGASLACEARRAGLVATIIEPRNLAAGASGNPAGLIMPRLDLGDDPTAQFFIQAYLHVLRLLTDLNAAYPGGNNIFNPCGVLLGAPNAQECERQRKILAKGALPANFIQARERGLFFPQAGVVDPRKFVAALVGDTPVVTARTVAIERGGDALAIHLDDGDQLAFDAVVIANGVEALSFLETRALPLSAVAGQIDWFPGAPAPEHALAFGPYAAPAPDSGVVIGATYEKLGPGARISPSRAATEKNINAIAAFAPEIAARLDAQKAHSRVSARCQTPDHAPVAGPIPDLAFYGRAYDGLTRGAQRDYPPGEMIPGVYILSGLGSRGLVTAPLASAMIIAAMTGALSPLAHDIAQALHPARFFIRDLKQNRTIRKG